VERDKNKGLKKAREREEWTDTFVVLAERENYHRCVIFSVVAVIALTEAPRGLDIFGRGALRLRYFWPPMLWLRFFGPPCFGLDFFGHLRLA
jgi:hypothetical protein